MVEKPHELASAIAKCNPIPKQCKRNEFGRERKETQQLKPSLKLLPALFSEAKHLFHK
jgi:hypothetical protein